LGSRPQGWLRIGAVQWSVSLIVFVRCKERLDAAKLGKTGAWHLFRHTMATLMHEGGADIRYIQQMPDHEDIKTTQIYTQVSIRALQQIHAAAHPGTILERGVSPARKADDPAAEALFRVLAQWSKRTANSP
jgi:integrase/recombinase XerD